MTGRAAGRPTLPADRRRTTRLVVYLTAAESAALERRARREHRPVSAQARTIILDGLQTDNRKDQGDVLL